MRYRRRLASVVFVLVVCLNVIAKEQSPNIIFIMTDDYMQGKSFINTLQGKAENNWRTATYYCYWMHIIHHYVPAHFGIRTKDYKLMFYYGKHYLPQSEFGKHYWAKQYYGIENETPHTWELYDLRNDPQELHNRYNDATYKEIVAELKRELKKQRIELNETDAKFPAIQAIVDEHWHD